jgi:hypothetical protein
LVLMRDAAGPQSRRRPGRNSVALPLASGGAASLHYKLEASLMHATAVLGAPLPWF